uniref:Centromere protein X n=1 Tax=Picea sitchensis TaxID=3332 RepID=A9NXK2_PICSI|nr:unknown [Picea sitchensis]
MPSHSLIGTTTTNRRGSMEDYPNPFNPETIHELFKLVWSQTNKARAQKEGGETELEVGAAASKKTRTTTANSNALKLSCEFLRLFVTEAVQRAAIVAEVEGSTQIEGTHLERILPQLLLDF